MATTKVITVFAALALAGGGAVGCGDDDEGGGAPPPANTAPKKPTPPKPAGAKGEALSFVPTLERTVPEGERKKIRRRLTDRDFVGSPDGSGNRDPFRSFVLPLPGVPGGPGSLVTQPTVEPTDLCSKRNLVASTYSVSSLSLIGIVKKGAVFYAMFRDTGGRGHIVDKKKCLGKEKAQITEITEDFVTYAIIPEQIPGQPLRPSIEDTILLHPNELRPEEQFDDDQLPVVPPADSTEVQPPLETAPDQAPSPPPPGGGT